MNHLAEPAETPIGSGFMAAPSANGVCFPYRLRFWLADPADHVKFLLSQKENLATGSSSMVVVGPPGSLSELDCLHTTICAITFDEAISVLRENIAMSSFTFSSAESRVKW